MVLRASLVVTLFALVTTVPASAADATAVARAHSEAFGHACAAGDIPAVLALYEDDAMIVWPGQGEEAHGKAAIGKLAAELCKGKDKPVLKSVAGRWLGKGYVVTDGRWEVPGPDGKPSLVRTTEVLHETGGKWRYIADHASIGLPPPPPPAAAGH